MDWKPAARVVVNGADVTGLFMPRLSSLTIMDTAGIQSDTLELMLTDTNPLARLAIPPTGAEIEVSLGYAFSSQIVGLYVADELEVGGPPDYLRITAYASAHGETDGGRHALTEQFTRSWPEGTTVKALVEKIASDSGFEAAVSETAGEVELPHLDQIDESNLNLLTRVARENGLVFKPGGGRLIVVEAGESASVKGEPLPRVLLTPGEVSSWRMVALRREAVREVVTTYRDILKSERVEVTAEAPPTAYTEEEILNGVSEKRRVARSYATRKAAVRAAQQEVKLSIRRSRQLSVTLPGRADLMAEGRLIMAGFRPGVDGEWLIRQVAHTLDAGGWRSAVEAELPPTE